ncbi:protein of unknown function [Candidatus Filomicrobium marinum]|uniref:Uncharacterized protein n=1 Tax=Candidatus Filomicrobium marinum TaxID=1608628 RepID=A0A0D6JIM6_9HYPH|nr:protein of unknown function [Candidatus Filomicrobium marinum]CPR21283.1 protein of unknown function [Candidatus Filomicrobium marinum]
MEQVFPSLFALLPVRWLRVATGAARIRVILSLKPNGARARLWRKLRSSSPMAALRSSRRRREPR